MSGLLLCLLSVAVAVWDLWTSRQIVKLKAEILAMFRDEPSDSWLVLADIIRKIERRRARNGKRATVSIVAACDALSQLEESSQIYRLISGDEEKTRSRWHLMPYFIRPTA